MTAMQLNNIKLDIIGMVMDTDDEQLLSKVVSCFTSTEYKRIPGFAYTREERLTDLRKAEEDIRAGRGIPHEEMVQWMRNVV